MAEVIPDSAPIYLEGFANKYTAHPNIYASMISLQGLLLR